MGLSGLKGANVSYIALGGVHYQELKDDSHSRLNKFSTTGTAKGIITVTCLSRGNKFSLCCHDFSCFIKSFQEARYLGLLILCK